MSVAARVAREMGVKLGNEVSSSVAGEMGCRMRVVIGSGAQAIRALGSPTAQIQGLPTCCFLNSLQRTLSRSETLVTFLLRLAIASALKIVRRSELSCAT